MLQPEDRFCGPIQQPHRKEYLRRQNWAAVHAPREEVRRAEWDHRRRRQDHAVRRDRWDRESHPGRQGRPGRENHQDHQVHLGRVHRRDRPDRESHPARRSRPDRESHPARRGRPDRESHPGHRDRPGHADRRGRRDHAERNHRLSLPDGGDGFAPLPKGLSGAAPLRELPDRQDRTTDAGREAPASEATRSC